MMQSYVLGQFLTVLLMALALGMDAFSLGIGVGMKGIRLAYILRLSIIIGLFHIFMPLIGMFMGHYVSSLLGHVAAFVGGGLLVLLGGHMIYSSFHGKDEMTWDTRSMWGTSLFALSVSIDSFSVGVSMGLFAADLILTVLMFGLVGGLMSVFGLLVGKKVRGWVGEYGEAFGGIILLAFGLKILI